MAITNKSENSSVLHTAGQGYSGVMDPFWATNIKKFQHAFWRNKTKENFSPQRSLGRGLRKLDGQTGFPKNYKTPFFSRYSNFLLMGDWNWSKNDPVFFFLKSFNKYGWVLVTRRRPFVTTNFQLFGHYSIKNQDIFLKFSAFLHHMCVLNGHKNLGLCSNSLPSTAHFGQNFEASNDHIC